jgi:hypothetical protein
LTSQSDRGRERAHLGGPLDQAVPSNLAELIDHRDDAHAENGERPPAML